MFWNDRPFYEFLSFDDGVPTMKFHETIASNDSDSGVPGLADDSDDSNSEDNRDDDLETDTNEYHWSAVNVTSLPKSKRNLVKKLTSKNYLEYDESSSPPIFQFVWKVDGLSRRPDCDSLYVRYWDASLPKPRDVNSFEYTLLSKFLSWARPESFRLEGAVSSQGDLRPENAVRSAGDFRSEGAVSSEGDPRSEGGFRDIEPPVNTASPPRRSSRLIATKIPVRAAMLQHKRLLHFLHKHIPIRLTRRRKNGSIKKYKVRLVARGDLQDPSTYNETYASTCQRKAVMLLLSLANQRNWEISTADISPAFLYGDLDEPIFMELPDGKIVRLLKSIYGLKQAAYKFKEHLHENLVKIGFKPLETDSSVYYLSDSDGRVVYLTSHEDYLLKNSFLIFHLKILAKFIEVLFIEKMRI